MQIIHFASHFQVWFKNRRAKARQQKKAQQNGSCGASGDRSSSNSDGSNSATAGSSNSSSTDQSSGNSEIEIKTEDMSGGGGNDTSQQDLSNPHSTTSPSQSDQLDIKNMSINAWNGTLSPSTSYAATFPAFRQYPGAYSYQTTPGMEYLQYPPVTGAATYMTPEWKFSMNT